MFLINSRHPLFCDTPTPVAQCEVTLIPKLRVQFAEFLQHSSLKRLGMLYLTTCVGFGYGLCVSYFQGQLPCQDNPISPDKLRHPSLLAGAGIFTCFPSTTLFSLALGAD